ncbi:MAG: M56 family metallopeptidase [Bacillota bacterium]|jgi:beta-lactamase regulating signal transducer with metallopeptidase domain
MIDTIISSSALILIILAVRFVFKGKINPMVQYGLWSLVVLRLAAFGLFDLHQVESAFSVMNAVSSAEATIRGASDVEQVLAGHAEAEAIDNAVLIMNNVQTGVMTSGEGISAAAAIDWQLLMMIVWAVGAFALALWLIHVNRKFGKKIFNNRMFLMTVRADENGLVHRGADIKTTKLLSVYVVEGLDSPCLMGYKGEAAIYVPSEVAADQEKLRFAIAHELCHYKHHDLIWAIVRGGLLAFYWFNPLVWVAAIMSKRDCELACDYGVLKEIGKEDRLAYGRTLVDLISQTGHRSDVLQMATTMYGSTNGVKERITMIAKNKKMKTTTLIAVLLIAIFAVGCTFTAAPNNVEGLSNDDKNEIEAFAIKWADAYSDRDAETIYGLCENKELYLTIGGVSENGEYWMGMSSPWPWNKDYVIDIVDSSHIDIYYYFRTSSPTVYTLKETVIIKEINGEYKAIEESWKSFDKIESKADFNEAYKYGFPDFSEFAAAYQSQADDVKYNKGRKTILENPVSAAIDQLNLVGAKVSATYEDRTTDPAIFGVKFKWDDGEVEVKLIQPMLTDENGAKRQASIWIVVNEDPTDNNAINNGTTTSDPQHIEKISAYMEEECRKVFSPYYELLDFQISDYQEEVINGNVEATFFYKIISKNYDKDPDTVGYIKEAKESGNKNYQQMYDEYLQPREMNFHLKVVIDKNDLIIVYSNISPKGIEWEETKMSDFILK